MIPSQTFETYPPFGDNATKVQPDSAKYSQGFLQADVLPAEWMNWAWGKNTRCITDLNTGLASVETEINSVLSARNITPDGSATDQLLAALNSIKAEAILAAHPVGSLYWSSVATSPASLFGGTWKQIKDTFIWAKGDSDTVDATGGAKTVTLTTQEIPSHSHTFTGTEHSHSYTPAGTISVTTNPTFTGTEHSHSYTPQGKIASTSGGTDNKTASESAHTHGLSGTLTTKNTIEIGSTTAKTLSGKLDYLLSKTNLQPTTNGIVSVTLDDALASDGTNWGIRKMGITLDATHRHQVDLSGNTGAGSAHSHTAYFTGTAATLKATAGGSISGGAYKFTGTAATLKATAGGSNANTGGGEAHNNMPPYTVKYCWERTA